MDFTADCYLEAFTSPFFAYLSKFICREASQAQMQSQDPDAI